MHDTTDNVAAMYARPLVTSTFAPGPSSPDAWMAGCSDGCRLSIQQDARSEESR
jgi:hypothetical protein